MGKNKTAEKKAAKEKAVETKKGETKAKVETKATEVKEKSTIKVDPKPAPTPEPAPKAEEKPTEEGGVQVISPVEQSSAQLSAEVFQNEDLRTLLMKDVLTPETTIDANHMVELAKVATERFKTKDQKDPRVIATNEMIDDVTAYCLALAGINMQIHGKKLGLSVPVEATASFVRTMGFFGVALPEGKAIEDPKNPGQMILPFEASEEAVKTVKEEIKIQKSKPTMDPSLWKSDDDAKKAVRYIMSDTLTKDNRFLVSISKVRMYKMLTSANEDEKKMWESSSNAAILEVIFNILGDSKSTLMNAIGGQIYSAAATRKNPVLSHLVAKRNFSQFSDEDIRDITKVFVKFKAADTSKDPLENNIAWVGLTQGKKEDALLYPKRLSDFDKNVMNRIDNLYPDKVGVPSDPDYRRKASNLMITIMNLYKENDLLPQVSETDYKQAVEDAVKATSGETAPKEEPKPAEDKKDKGEKK